MSEPVDFDPQEPLQPQVEGEPQTDPKDGYEFNAYQNSVIRALARKMKYVGFIYVFAGGLMTLMAILALLMRPLFGLFYLLVLAPWLLIGIWNIKAANSFGFVVETQGNDIHHLMDALIAQRKLYTVMFWLMVLALALVVVGIAGGIFIWSSGGIHVVLPK